MVKDKVKMSVVRRLRQVRLKETGEYFSNCLLLQESQGKAKSTMKNERDLIKILLGHAPENFFDSHEWLMVITNLLKGKNPAYYNKMLSIFKKFFNYLIDEGIIELIQRNDLSIEKKRSVLLNTLRQQLSGC